jgi:hypothetical protein
MEKCELVADGKVVEFFIDDEIRDRLPKLGDYEYGLLKGLILEDNGLTNSLVLWDSPEGKILVDGHNRYRAIKELIAEGHNNLYLWFYPKKFKSKAEVFYWMETYQSGMKNLNPYSRVAIRLRHEEKIVADYKDTFINAIEKGEDKDLIDLLKRVDPKFYLPVGEKLPPTIKKKLLENTRRGKNGIIAFISKVSVDFVHWVRFIENTGSDELREALSSGNKVSVKAAFNELKASMAPTKPHKPVPIVLFENWPTKMIRKGDNVYISGPVSKDTMLKLADLL